MPETVRRPDRDHGDARPRRAQERGAACVPGAVMRDHEDRGGQDPARAEQLRLPFALEVAGDEDSRRAGARREDDRAVVRRQVEAIARRMEHRQLDAFPLGEHAALREPHGDAARARLVRERRRVAVPMESRAEPQFADVEVA